MPYEPIGYDSASDDANDNRDDYELIVAGWGATDPNGILFQILNYANMISI